MAAVLSGLLHLVLAGVLIWASHARPRAPEPPDAGAIEMVMVRQRGTTPTPPQPTPHPAAAAVQSKAPPSPNMPATPANRTSIAAPVTAAATAPAPSAPVATPEQQKQSQTSNTPAPKPPVFDLAGTDDDFNAIASGGKIIPASPDSRYRNDPPRYPREAALRREQGTVVVLIHVSDSGMATGADIIETSGVPSLDDAALAAVRRWHFLPALRDGKAVPFNVPFRFVFEGE